MNKKFIIIFLVLIIGFILVSIPYFNNDVKARSDYEAEIQKIDSDGDHLYDYYEVELGTDPFNADTDFDMLTDIEELYLGTSATCWDTDNDNMADGNEQGTNRGSTSPFETDSDSDGLPDPWEDNDSDGILNREEQLPIHDGVMYYTDMFHDPPEEHLSSSPNDADTDGDGWDDGYEIQVNSVHTGSNAVNPPPPVDRQNSDLDIAVSSSWAYTFWSNVGGWDSATFADWRNGLKLAASYNLLPSNCTKIAWYHFSPYYVYEQRGETGDFSDWKNDTFHGANEQNYGALDRGAPYNWNLYDCDPTLNDTDTDVMDDNWDPFPLRINLRNGTFAAINSIQRVGGDRIVASSPKETTWDFFGQNISILSLEKGDIVDINISVGLERCNPQNATHDNYKQGYYSPLRVIIRFRPIALGMDGIPHTDDDDIENFTNVARVTRTFTNVQFGIQHMVPGMQEVNFTNHLDIQTTITFFYQTFRIRIPSRVPAGHIAITVESETTDNFHYFPSDPFMVY
jgi:hypothetical protein